MIQFRAKKKYFYYSLLRVVITSIAALPTAIYALYRFIYALIHPDALIESSQMLLIWLSIPLLVLNLFFVIFGVFYKKHLARGVACECYEIVDLVKLPDTLPKVVYVYTSHGDMIESRILQNAKQTYSNIEIWISEGSERQDIIDKSRIFAEQNHFKFYSVGGVGSSNKAENLNSFLAKSGATFDYLLITDADEALDDKFVEYAIKCFYWKGFKNLGFVSPINYVYETDNLFSNICGNSDTYSFCVTHFNKSFTFGTCSNLYSASCLISKKLLELNNNLFPSGCLEDYFLESVNARTGGSSIILPIAPCGQAYDKNFNSFIKRVMRVNDWQIYLFKKEKFQRYNEKYSGWFTELRFKFFEPLLYLLSFLGFWIFVWVLWCWWSKLFNNIFFIYTICSMLATLIVSILVKIVNFTCLNKYKWIYPLFAFFVTFASIPYKIKHWFNSIIKSKYSSFGGSNHAKRTSINPVLKWILLLLLCLMIDGLIISTFILFVNYSQISIKLLYSFIFITLSLITLISLSLVVVNVLGNIKCNKSYNINQPIYKTIFNK